MLVSAKPLAAVAASGIGVPPGYKEARDLNLVNLHPWHLLSDAEFDYFSSGLAKRFPGRVVIPFARRVDNDDVSCFVVRDPEQAPGQVIVIHDFASPGHEVVGRIKTFWNWFRYATDEMIEWHEGAADT